MMQRFGFLIFILLLFPVALNAGKKQSSEFQWEYKGKRGPDYWGDLGSDYVRCKVGKKQSPVNFVATLKRTLPEFKLDYFDSPIHLMNNGHTIVQKMDGKSTIRIGHRVYPLVQLHFHSPSEHQVDGREFPLEIHLVHQDVQGHYAVIGLFVEEGDAHPVVETLWNFIPEKGKEWKHDYLKLNAKGLLPEKPYFYWYNGSLTTPPCTEFVNWIVMSQPISLSKEQIKKFRSFYHQNVRPIQPLYDRHVLRN